MSGGGPICPYCGKESNYPDECPLGEDETVTHECACGKAFGYRVSWSPDYTVKKAPCLNEEGDHEWFEEVQYPPARDGNSRWVCVNCGESKRAPATPTKGEKP